MRYIYVDEAGTSKSEPVTVVAGIMVHADTQFTPAEEMLEKLLADAVPDSLKPNFVSHAMAIWGDPKIRDVWPMEGRIDFLKKLAAIPQTLSIPVFMGMVRRTYPGNADEHHAYAFGLCLAHADAYIRQYFPNEVATVVAENIPEMHKSLRAITKRLRKDPLRIMVSMPGGKESFETEYRISKIKDTIHFAAKEDSPFLQIADICAWALRRFFNKQKLGVDIGRIIAGPGLVSSDWDQSLHASAMFLRYYPARS